MDGGEHPDESLAIMKHDVRLIEKTLAWQPSHNGVMVDASMDVRIHPLASKRVLLILPGVDGSVDGYEGKYIEMANKALTKGYGVVRVSNPFISSFHWGDNLRQAISYINANSQEHFDNSEVTISVIAHSAGASVAAWTAWEYPNIEKLILINAASKLKPELIISGLGRYNGDVHLVYGSKDPSVDFIEQLPSKYKTTIVEGADHVFSGHHLKEFINVATLLGT